MRRCVTMAMTGPRHNSVFSKAMQGRCYDCIDFLTRSEFDVLDFAKRGNVRVKAPERIVWVLTSDFTLLQRVWDVLPFHLQVDALDAAYASHQAKALILCGDSGSGKTLSAVASCKGGDDGVCVFISMSSLECVETEQDTQQRDKTLRISMLSHIQRLAPKCTKPFAGRVVVVLDEAGGYPNSVRAVCSGRAELLRQIGMLLQAAEVRLVVCGTGAEGAPLSPGSAPESYRRIVMSSDAISLPFLEGEVFEQLLKRCPPLAAVLAPDKFCGAVKGGNVKSLDKFPELLQMTPQAKAAVLRCKTFELFRQVMHDRRVAAVIVDHLATVAVGSISNWFSVIPTLMQVGLLGYRSRNSLSDQGDDASTWGRIALSFALGGAEQQIPPGHLVRVRTTLGLLCDNAQAAPKRESSTARSQRKIEHRVVMSGTECGLLAPTASSGDDHLFHRYAMSGAMAAMISTDFGCDVREQGGTGFEHTVGDAQYMWLLGSSSRRTAIAPLLPDGVVALLYNSARSPELRDRQRHAAHRLHALMRWMSCASEDPGSSHEGPQDVFLIHSTAQLTNIGDCWQLAVMYARWKKVGKERFIGAVIVNGPQAPYADVIGVYGQRNSAAPSRVLLTKCKHYTETEFPLAMCNDEFTQMCPSSDDSHSVKALILVLGGGGSVKATSFRRVDHPIATNVAAMSGNCEQIAEATTPTFVEAPDATSDDLCAVWADDTTFNMAMHPMKIAPWFCAERGSLEGKTELLTCVSCRNAGRRLADEMTVVE